MNKRRQMTFLCPFYISVTLSITSCQERERKIDTYENLKKELKGVELEKTTPHADPGGFESEVNNGGLNQYFFNSSGQNCFETLRYFKQTGKVEEAKILEEAIKLINPKKLSEEELVDKLRKRTVDELDDSVVNKKLEILDETFFELK
jgi:uncharacterized protein DUF4375